MSPILRETLGAVPQSGVNPLQLQKQPLQNTSIQPQGLSQRPLTPQLHPELIERFRTDPEIVQAITQFMGRPVNMAEVPAELLVELAGMIQALGIEGAIVKFQEIVPPQILQQLKQAI